MADDHTEKLEIEIYQVSWAASSALIGVNIYFISVLLFLDTTHRIIAGVSLGVTWATLFLAKPIC